MVQEVPQHLPAIRNVLELLRGEQARTVDPDEPRMVAKEQKHEDACPLLVLEHELRVRQYLVKGFLAEVGHRFVVWCIVVKRILVCRPPFTLDDKVHSRPVDRDVFSVVAFLGNMAVWVETAVGGLARGVVLIGLVRSGDGGEVRADFGFVERVGLHKGCG